MLPSLVFFFFASHISLHLKDLGEFCLKEFPSVFGGTLYICKIKFPYKKEKYPPGIMRNINGQLLHPVTPWWVSGWVSVLEVQVCPLGLPRVSPYFENTHPFLILLHTKIVFFFLVHSNFLFKKFRYF